MDKNFIKVDDLVRQRLEGREEREPSGAWLNMRELLDEEMPQRKVVPFFWNRMFGAVGVLVLLGLITVGGYELSSFKETGNNAPVASAATVGTTGMAHTQNLNAEVAANNQLSSAGVNDAPMKNSDANVMPVRKAEHKKAATTDKTNNKDANSAKSTAVTGTISHATDSKPTASNVKAHNKKNTNTSAAPANDVAGKIQHTATAAVATATNKADKPVALVAVPADVQHRGNTNAAAPKHATAANTTAVTVKNEAKHNRVTAQPSSVATTGTADKTPKSKANGAGVDMKTMALSSSSSSVNTANNAPVSIAATTANKTCAPAVKVSGNAAMPGNSIGKPSAKQGTTGNNTGTAEQKMAATKLPNNSMVNNSKGKRTIERMIVLQRSIKTEQRTTEFHVDTISIETLTEELGMNAPAASSPEAVAKKSNLGNMISNTVGADNAPILPGAAANAANTPAAAAKTATATKNTSSVSPVEKLKEEFNDVKTKVSLIRFAPGLTAGINGTFFGPNSFKGFQFGLTGELFFNDDLGLMTEFKYFHRINNDYQVNDNYYNYLNNGTKQLMLNSYSFSTLHSLEMPISIRYNKGNFTFFAGGNIVYSFSINTGAATIASPAGPVATSIPASQANDNAPKLNTSDFNSRFGLGYLFGFAYKVSPNVTLDLRDVQSFWDNAKDGGAKSVSTQLYKSPSFQFSLNYRLGKRGRGE